MPPGRVAPLPGRVKLLLLFTLPLPGRVATPPSLKPLLGRDGVVAVDGRWPELEGRPNPPCGCEGRVAVVGRWPALPVADGRVIEPLDEGRDACPADDDVEGLPPLRLPRP